jgi:crossover junction endodeoxyribonuclease RuvC
LQVELESLLDEFSPSTVAIERIFFQVNVRTAMSVGQASGVVLATVARRGVPVVQYTPTQVKSAVAGDGRADKSQIQKMVRMRLHLSRPPTPADAADAAAIALCHIASAPLQQRLQHAFGRPS